MAAIADCNKSIKNMGSNDGAYELQKLMKLIEESVNNNKAIVTSGRPTPQTNAEKKVDMPIHFRGYIQHKH